MADELGEWLDSSKIDLLNLCEQKFYYRHELHLVPLGDVTKPSPMLFGTAIHAGLAPYYRGEGFIMDHCPCPTMDGCDICHGKLIPRMLARFLIWYPVDPDPDDDKIRTRQRGLEILTAYVRKWGRESFSVVDVEVPFVVQMTADDGSPFTYTGRIDLLIREHPSNQLKPKDHKTASRFGVTYPLPYNLSGQCTGYMRCTSIITGEQVNGMVINAIRTTSKIDNDSFIRFEITRNPEDFERWEREVKDAYRRIQTYRRMAFWPRRAPYACSAYFRICEYYGICTATRSAIDNLLANNYQVVEWNPTADVGE